MNAPSLPLRAPLECDLLVIGAGPAGLAAATRAARLGLDTVLIDEQPAPGGQIYRAIGSTPVQDRAILGADYWHGLDLLAPFRASGARHVAGAMVWAVNRRDEGGFEVAYSNAAERTGGLLHCRHIVLATGAQERPFPVPGWTLPGVLTAGAAQILLKTAGVVPTGTTVLAGAGPLLYLLAWQYLNAGVKIHALLETGVPGQWRRALPHAWGFLRSPYLGKGLKLLRAVKAQVPVVGGVGALEAIGVQGRLAQLRYEAGGETRTIDVDQLLLHQGVVPNTQLSRAIGADHAWNERQDCWEPVVDAWGATSVPQLTIAGDGAGIAGAVAAEHRGRLAALHAAASLGVLDAAARDREAAPHRAALSRATRGREFFETLYRVPERLRRPVGDTIVCRCEEVTAAQVREATRLGCQGPNQLKAFLRCGMGPCQGRFCGLTVTEVMADEQGRHPRDVGSYRVRFPIKPVTLGEIAALPQTQASREAVVRFKKP
ncbi:thioredoxin reductase/bacterioferritin-associated ferredoxin [Variovorax sp. TBS-050B]|uniref:FAD/NAD(P)-dependent oxidoreductase n=1 Tax=Variovorax sp. TBS-050B TaxID=2940551 RepID=UPI0024734F5E|nr:NAD(P)/FAD-dependent oxidoreductase [Variovorax sp. TBS-050B]MDH6590207.1 thioredoxin reductase/bacterioferritin-associated ferredoxin [Variovorax sp. TBS-050B]